MRYFIDEVTESVIGFRYLIKQLDIKSPYGIKHLEKVTPYCKNDELIEEYELINRFFNNSNTDKIESLISKFKDISGIINNTDNTLGIVDLFEIKIQALLMNELKEAFNSEFDIHKLIIYDCKEIIELLSPSVGDNSYDFYIYNTYSQQLTEIRNKKREIEKQFFQNKDESKRDTIKIERSKYVILEEEEELKIRKMLTDKLSNIILVMKENIKTIGHIDYLIAKAKLAIKYGGTIPEITKNELKLIDMVNPFIQDEVVKMGNQYTKNSINMNYGTTVITGANMSGKSSVLKTVILNIFLANLGFFVFCKQALIPLYDSIIYIGTQNDSNRHGLSSFGLEIESINNAIKDMKTKKCFVCIDEFARSTNPSEGQKFVKAFALFANKFSSHTLLATHYDNVVSKNMNHFQIAGLKEEVTSKTTATISEIQKYMDYSLKKVSNIEKVPKEAYNVSLLLDIDRDFLEYLNKCYGE